jgi:hypothetical protein
MWAELSSRDFQGNAVDEGADGGAARLDILSRGLLSQGVFRLRSGNSTAG